MESPNAIWKNAAQQRTELYRYLARQKYRDIISNPDELTRSDYKSLIKQIQSDEDLSLD
jgi:hypothetical protein